VLYRTSEQIVSSPFTACRPSGAQHHPTNSRIAAAARQAIARKSAFSGVTFFHPRMRDSPAPLDAEEAGSPATKAYAEAFAKLETHDPAAIGAFAALVGLRPADPLAQYHLKRLLNGSVGTEIVTQ
jgi:hypothetical protein